MPKWRASTKLARFRCPTHAGTSRSSRAIATRPRNTCVDAVLFLLAKRWVRGHRAGVHHHVGDLFAGLDKELVRYARVNVNHVARRHFSGDSVSDGSAPDLAVSGASSVLPLRRSAQVSPRHLAPPAHRPSSHV